MERLIDADAFDKRIRLAVGSCEEELTEDFKDGISTILEMMKTAPTVDAVTVRHGRWQWISSTYDRVPCEKRYWCSKCHHETITHDSEPWEKFCPNCGARMNGKDGDDETD